jgi:regulator of protease activity HflC (stomatin/prohibitin superfamily)
MNTMQPSVEREIGAAPGGFMLAAGIGSLLLAVVMIFGGIANGSPAIALAGVLLLLGGIFTLNGLFTLQPNEARLMILFGDYRGTVRRSGFWWANPFYARVRGRIHTATGADAVTEMGKSNAGTPLVRYQTRSAKMSLRTRNFNSDILKVNDKRGNPVEIAAVIVWRVGDTAKAAFDVDDFEGYVRIQSETAIRHIASIYGYDHGEEHEPTLRASAIEVAGALTAELQQRLDKAGLVIEETRLTHLAYAPEIAQIMLRRQQAEAIIAARKQIVQGAVGMVDLALRELAEKQVVPLDDDRKAAMVSNLLVVLCAESDVKPVVNTGTLYH